MNRTVLFYSGISLIIPVLLLVSSALTALYMVRQWRFVFWGTYHNKGVSPAEVHDPDWLMRLPIGVLAALSMFVWFAPNPLSTHQSWVFNVLPVPAELTLPWLAPVSIGLVLLGGWLGFRMGESNHRRSYVRLSVEAGFLDMLYQYLIINPSLRLASLLNRTDQRAVDGVVNGAGVSTVVLAHLTGGLDRFGIDGVVNGMAWLAGRLGRLTRSVQNGRVQSYITAAVVGLLLVLWWIL